MSNPILTTTHSKLDTRVKEPSGVPTHDRFNNLNLKHTYNTTRLNPNRAQLPPKTFLILLVYLVIF